MKCLTDYNVVVIENGRLVIYEFTCEERIAYEVEKLQSMTDEEVCKTFNVDSREEAIEGINEYYTYIH